MITLNLWNILFSDLHLNLTFKSGQPHFKKCICPYVICLQNISFGTFVKMVLIKNNDIYIYIFADLSAILNLCKLDNHIIEICGYTNKQSFQNILKYH